MRPVPLNWLQPPSKPFSLTLEAKHGFCCFLHSVDSPPLPSTLNVLIPTPTSNHFQKLPSCQGPAEDSFPLLEATVFFLLFYFLATPKILVFGSQFPDQGSNLHPLHWECGILTTGPPGKSLGPSFKNLSSFIQHIQSFLNPPHVEYSHNNCFNVPVY